MLVPLPGVVDGFGKIAGGRTDITRRSVRLIDGEIPSWYGSCAIREVRALGPLSNPLG